MVFTENIYHYECIKMMVVLSLGGRGIEYWLWNTTSSMINLKTTFTDTSPVPVQHGILYTAFDIDDDHRFDERHEAVGYKFKGFFRPPHTGGFRIMVRSDDASEFWLSMTGSKSDLVIICYSDIVNFSSCSVY